MTGPAVGNERTATAAHLKPAIRRLFCLLGRWRWPAVRHSAIRRSPDKTPRSRPRNRTWRRSTEVIQKHPDDPQAYNMRGSAYGEAGKRGGARRLQQSDQSRSQLRAGLRQPRPALSPEQQTRSGARRLRQGAVDRRHLCAGLSRPRHRLPPARSQPSGARRLQQGDRAAARQCGGLLQSRPALSEPASAPDSPSTISRPRSGSRRKRPTST